MMFRERRLRADEVYAPNSQKLPRILFERAAKYLHRILNGETPRKLPVQTGDGVSDRYKSEGRGSARPDALADSARPRRRGDRIAMIFCCGA
jgi:hypothetical protein